MQLGQRVVHPYLQARLQLGGEATRLRTFDERDDRLAQGAVLGELHAAEAPQAVLVIVGDPVQGVIAPSMRVTGPASQLRQLAEEGDSGGPSQGFGHSIQRQNPLFLQPLNQFRGGVLLGTHEATSL